MQGMRKGIALGDIYPTFCVSALRDMGVRRMVTFLDNVAPCVIESVLLVATGDVEIAPDATTPVNLYFSKSIMESHVDGASYFGVTGDALKEGIDLTDANNDSKEHLGRINAVADAQKGKMSQPVAGDFGAAVRPKDIRHGATLNDKDMDYQFPSIEYPTPKHRHAIVPVNGADTERLSKVLIRMQEGDPIRIAQQSKRLRQLIMYGWGGFHLHMLE